MYNANFADTFCIIFPRTSNGIKKQMKIQIVGTTQRDVSRKKNKQRGGGVGVRARELSLSLFSSLFFSRTLPSRRTRLSERLEQAKSSKK